KRTVRLRLGPRPAESCSHACGEISVSTLSDRGLELLWGVNDPKVEAIRAIPNDVSGAANAESIVNPVDEAVGARTAELHFDLVKPCAAVAVEIPERSA